MKESLHSIVIFYRDQFPDVIGYVQPMKPLILSDENVQVFIQCFTMHSGKKAVVVVVVLLFPGQPVGGA